MAKFPTVHTSFGAVPQIAPTDGPPLMFCRDHEVPFQCPSVVSPAIQRSESLDAHTAWRSTSPGTTCTFTGDHCEPFQCSIIVPPTDHTSFAAIPQIAAPGRDETALHCVPFQCKMPSVPTAHTSSSAAPHIAWRPLPEAPVRATVPAGPSQ